MRLAIVIVMLICAGYAFLAFANSVSSGLFHGIEALLAVLVIAVCASAMHVVGAIEEKRIPKEQLGEIRKIVEDAMFDDEDES
jgi:hypothetical protein